VEHQSCNKQQNFIITLNILVVFFRVISQIGILWCHLWPSWSAIDDNPLSIYGPF